MRWDGTDLKQHLRVLGPLPFTLTARGQALDDVPMPKQDQPAADPDAREPIPTGFPAGPILMAPKGDQALAVYNNDFYVVTVPMTGGTVPTVNVSKPDSAAVPVRKLTDIGGEFPAWGADGRTIVWSIGNAFVTYRLDQAQAIDDSLFRANADSAARARAAYRPVEQRFVVSAPRDIPEGTVVLRGARAVTMKGHEIVENADIVIRNNRIVSVGPARPGAGRRAGHRRERQDHRAGLRRHPLPHVAGLGTPLAAALDLSGQSGLRRHHHPRSADRHHRRAHLRRPGRGRLGDRPPDLLHRARASSAARRSAASTTRGTCSSATATTTTPRRSRCTWRATASSGSGSSWRRASSSSCRPPRAGSTTGST